MAITRSAKKSKTSANDAAMTKVVEKTEPKRKTAAPVKAENAVKKQMDGRTFMLVDVSSHDWKVSDFVKKTGADWKQGRGYYQFNKAEKVQSYKEIIVLDKAGKLHEGNGARKLLGLPEDEDAKIDATEFKNYTVFIQSTSHNRKLIHGTKFLYELV
eukprot:TRINITY_DN1100_c0_g1_i1.p1 TRINITY_DN1100_c0_g1~~TRINITY_DN1100_c0_g1_i1.p1  ORF type:complete len:157 (+),score=47.29 TRINITY_DN1100_c0_g1_i1:119-589(+)